MKKGRNYIAIVDNPLHAIEIRKETASIESVSSAMETTGEEHCESDRE